MANTKSTPGPWKLHGAHDDVVSDSGTSKGSFVAAPFGASEEQRIANARLICAAPALADALEMAFGLSACACSQRDLEIGGRGHLADCWVAVARTALRAAGRAP